MFSLLVFPPRTCWQLLWLYTHRVIHPLHYRQWFVASCKLSRSQLIWSTSQGIPKPSVRERQHALDLQPESTKRSIASCPSTGRGCGAKVINSCWKGTTKYTDKSLSKEIAQVLLKSSNGQFNLHCFARFLMSGPAICETIPFTTRTEERLLISLLSWAGGAASRQSIRHKGVAAPKGHTRGFGQQCHHWAGTEGRP